MLRRSIPVASLVALAAFPRVAPADIVCPDSSYCTVTFTTVRDRVTIAPEFGEALALVGITIRATLRNCSGAPLVGVPAPAIVVANPALCLCPGGNAADAPTDQTGSTSFTGFIRGGGCAESLDVVADGVRIGTVPVKTNSGDQVPASPCYVDAADLSAYASMLGRSDRYTVCADLNESGPPTINGGDLSYLASLLGQHCE